ncbi:fatty acid metabolism transcriptional regulator FadR, partial [Leptospira borgpetersenii serovar Hardjo-bovis]|nr:fatty acid metabolism transcriptional regulator FadR [Leptospira borgpetersenii serovar Hardjo-bovis]
IQHGKPTKVNNFWETSGLNILETLARRDHESVPQLIDNLLSVRTNIATIFIRTALRMHPERAREVLMDRKYQAGESYTFGLYPAGDQWRLALSDGASGNYYVSE